MPDSPLSLSSSYQLASGSVTSDDLVRRSLRRHRGQPAHPQRLPGGADQAGTGRCGRSRPQTRGGPRTSAARHPDRGQGRRRRRGRAHPVRHRRVRPAGRPGRRGGATAAGGGRGDRRQDQHLRAGSVAVHQRARPSATPAIRGRASTPRAARRAAAPPRWRPAWWPRRSAPTARAVSASRRRGPTWSASSRSAAGSPPGRCPRRSTASPSTACSPARSPTRRWCSTRRPATLAGDLHQPPPVRVSDYVGRAPGPLRIALSTKFPYTVFRAKLHPEIRAAHGRRRATQLEELGHTIVAADPDYDLRHVVELPVPVDVGAAGVGRPPGPRRHARQAHQGQHADRPAAVAARAAQGPRPRGACAPPDRVDLQPRRRRAGADHRTAAAPACTTTTTSAAWPPTGR